MLKEIHALWNKEALWATGKIKLSAHITVDHFPCVLRFASLGAHLHGVVETSPQSASAFASAEHPSQRLTSWSLFRAHLLAWESQTTWIAYVQTACHTALRGRCVLSLRRPLLVYFIPTQPPGLCFKNEEWATMENIVETCGKVK